MKSAALFGKEDVRLVDREIPEISDGDILLKVKAAAICGSDVRMVKNGYKNVDEGHPLILGHEFAGIIEKTGKNVKAYEPGQRVAVAPNIGCGVCDQCVSGNTHLCPTYEAFGINMDGGFAEYVKIPERAITQGNIARLGDNVSFAEAAIAEPFACVVNGQEMLNIRPGQSVLIIGSGPIGIMHAMFAKLQGSTMVMMNDLQEDRLAAAKKIIPDLITIPSAALAEELNKRTKGKGVDIAIIAAPSGKAQESSLAYMGMNGKVLFFGGLPAGNEFVSLNSNIIHYKQLGIFGSARLNIRQYRLVLNLVETGKLDLNAIITGRYAIDNFMQAMDTAKQAVGLKNVIEF